MGASETTSAAISAAPIVRNAAIGLFGTPVTLQNVLTALAAVPVIALLKLVSTFLRDWRSDRLAEKKIDVDKDASMRGDLWTMFKDHQAESSRRITELEKAVVDERVRCVQEMTDMQNRHSLEIDIIVKRAAAEIEGINKRHDQAIHELRGELEGMRKNFLQSADSARSLIQLPPNAPTMRKLLDDIDEAEGSSKD